MEEENLRMEKDPSDVSTPSVKRRRSRDSSQESYSTSPIYTAYSLDENKRNRHDYSNPFAVRDRMIEIDYTKFGSVSKDIEDLFSTRKQMLLPFLTRFPSLTADSVELKPVKDSSNVNDDKRHDKKTAETIIIIDSDDDDDEPTCQSPFQPDQDVVLTQFLGGDDVQGQASEGEVGTPTASEPNVGKNKNIVDDVENENDKNVGNDDVASESYENITDDVAGESDKAIELDDVACETNTVRENKLDEGVYVGYEDDDIDMLESDPESDINNDGLADVWNEMSIGLESSRVVDHSSNEHVHEEQKEEDCDHSFILKEDIGYVCRVCGIIQRNIESIIEFQRPKDPFPPAKTLELYIFLVKFCDRDITDTDIVHNFCIQSSKSIRTYYYEGQKKTEAADHILDWAKSPGTDFSVNELSAHPRHKMQMKPHQIEGFNFLLSNLASENPGGCILAHAPGSGKTFMLISFIQSFMAKYPEARPLVILPRGILGTWKNEFIRWQIEDLPLLDFYSVKADGRSQQLLVLKQWVNQRSILFLGYQQFSSIMCDNDTSSTTVKCQEILLTYPSILILDEGHFPRNQHTNIFTSLKKVRTPRKVVLSGTLYQNNVKQVFSLLDLVRPEFFKMENPKAIKRRILSRVGWKNLLKKCTNNEFYEVVEHTLVKDDNFKRKATVIEDLREMTSRVLHYYKGDFLDKLPGLVDFSIFLKLTLKQQHEVSELLKVTENIFKRSTKGSAIYVHPGLKSFTGKTSAKEKDDDSNKKIDNLLKKMDDETETGVKAKFFLNMLQLCESGGEKLLVFSQYLLPLKFLVRLTMKTKGWSEGKQIFMITGDHDNDERETALDQFNNSSESRVFFGSIRACGEGISLVGASRIIILDVHLNPAITRQAIGRAFRPSQTRKVYTYRLIAADSPEEEDHATCFRKESIAKMWFEWNKYCGDHDFRMETTRVDDCGDPFLETSFLSEDITAIYKR